MSLYSSAVKRPVMTTLCFVTVIILGLFSLAKLPIDLYPDIDTNSIMVITMYPGASAKDIECHQTTGEYAQLRGTPQTYLLHLKGEHIRDHS